MLLQMLSLALPGSLLICTTPLKHRVFIIVLLCVKQHITLIVYEPPPSPSYLNPVVPSDSLKASEALD